MHKQNNKPFNPQLTDEQRQSNLTEMIEMDKESIEDCLQFLGMDKDKWERMWGNIPKK